MIQLQNLDKSYLLPDGVRIDALRDVSLQVHAGEIFGVIGQSGAGKSTLIRCVNLLEKPTRGTVSVDGQDLTQLNQTELRQARHKIGMIFQHFNLLNSRTVYGNIAFPLELIGANKTTIAEKVQPLLELTGLADRRNHYPSQLSGGQKQRVAIARALASEPKVLLSDEATSALDPETKFSILQLLQEINERLGLTILLITHEMTVIKEICHRLAILEDGQIVEEAGVYDFFSRPQSDVAKKYVRSHILHELPDFLQHRLAEESNHAIPIWRLSFFGRAAEEPFISQLAQECHLNLNILQANIERIRNEVVGTMLVEVLGAAENRAKGLEFFSSKGVLVEVMGHVRHAL